MKMFYIVQFDSDILKEQTVVPSAWLNKNNTLCILPPPKSAVEIECLAQARAMPKEGWQMYKVLTLQGFDTFSQAKESLEKIKKAAAEGEEEEKPQARKRKWPSFMGNCDTSVDDEEDDDSRMMMADDTINSSAEENGANTDPLIVKVEPLAISRHFGSRRKVANSDQNPESFSCSDETSFALCKCACGSACHKQFLQSIAQVHRQLEANNRLLLQLVGSQAKASPVIHALPKNFPVTLPVKDVADFELINNYLEDDNNFAETLPYFSAFGGNDVKQTFKRVMEAFISYELCPTINWKGRGGKLPFSKYSKIHILIFSAMKQNPKSEVVTLSDVEKNIKDWFRFAPDRYGNRLKKKMEQEEKVLRC